jgi:hypothetical protein
LPDCGIAAAGQAFGLSRQCEALSHAKPAAGAGNAAAQSGSGILPLVRHPPVLRSSGWNKRLEAASTLARLRIRQ